MLTVERAILIITRIKLCKMIGKPATRHAIASGVSSLSRSTVYRISNRMIELGLLSTVENNEGNLELEMTTRGKELDYSAKGLF